LISTEFLERLKHRAQLARVTVSPEILSALEAYFAILRRWNARMNLTSLPLENPTDETLDRLFIEPLAAARYVANDGGVWFDLGSGGGSPAIPLKIARPSLRLVMTESKARKAAFLREVLRSLGLAGATVENARFEDIGAEIERSTTADLVTVRGVKADENLFTTAASLLHTGGHLLMFRPSDEGVHADGFELADTVQLLDSSSAFLSIFVRMFHVEHNR
jgi:16S rRNA (guanine527-N7)-methyltransferase